MPITTLEELTPGQLFHHKNVSDHPLNHCKYLGVTKTPTGRDSFPYVFRGKVCKGKASDLVIEIAVSCGLSPQD